MSVKTLIHGVERVEVTPIRKEGGVADRKIKIHDAAGNTHIIHLFSTMAHALIAQEEKGEQRTKEG